MVEHPVLARIQREGFTSFGWFEPLPEDGVPGGARFVILIGNAGPAMFRRFAREGKSMDEWTRVVVGALATDLDAAACYPFDLPALPFLTWARRAKAGYVSPLGLNIHPYYGLWHAFRAALLFPVVFDLPPVSAGAHPCETCDDKPCLHSCPVSAFDGSSYDVNGCASLLRSDAGQTCMTGGCLARRACPVGKAYEYEPAQKIFHMEAFLRARNTA